MKKLIIAVVVLLVIAAGWLLISCEGSDQVDNFDSEVASLEAELAEIEAGIESGALTPEEAAKAQVKLATRIDSVNEKVAASQKAKLTDSQRVQLIEGLDELKNVLVNYKETLATVDAKVQELPDEIEPKLRRGGSFIKGVADIASEVIEESLEKVGEVFEDIKDSEIAADIEIWISELGDDSTDVGESQDDDVDMADDSEDVSDDSSGSASSDDSEVSVEASSEFGFESDEKVE